LAWIDAGEALVWSSTTLVGAWLGLGYWALVLGAVVSGAVAMIVLCVQRPHHLLWPRDLRSIAHAMHLGWYVVISQLCWYVYSHADLTIVGRSEERRVGKECQWRGASYQYTRSETHDKSADE